uniref:Uncharacterized protein n=1 Tax=Steinernema glaseri TaxID=37863 RepID=A0A1I7YVA8_9BILA
MSHSSVSEWPSAFPPPLPSPSPTVVRSLPARLPKSSSMFSFPDIIQPLAMGLCIAHELPSRLATLFNFLCRNCLLT